MKLKKWLQSYADLQWEKGTKNFWVWINAKELKFGKYLHRKLTKICEKLIKRKLDVCCDLEER